MTWRPAMFLLFILALAGLARAVSIETTQPFATTRSGTVSWQTSVPIEASIVWVNATMVSIDAYDMDWRPTTGTMLVDIRTWGGENKVFRVTASTSTSLSFTIANPAGVQLRFLVNEIFLSSCGPASSTCSVTLSPTTDTTLRVTTNLGTTTNPGEGEQGQSETPPLSADGGGGAGAVAEEPSFFPTFNAPRVPEKYIPRFSAPQWFFIAIGIFLLVASARRGRAILASLPKVVPFVFLLALPSIILRFTGFFLIFVVWTSATNAPT